MATVENVGAVAGMHGTTPGPELALVCICQMNELNSVIYAGNCKQIRPKWA